MAFTFQPFVGTLANGMPPPPFHDAMLRCPI